MYPFPRPLSFAFPRGVCILIACLVLRGLALCAWWFHLEDPSPLEEMQVSRAGELAVHIDQLPERLYFRTVIIGLMLYQLLLS